MDCIGPIDPPSARGHRYALCVVDVNTRWPEVVCLRTLTAKATCDALLEIFARLGVPEVVCSDQGTNFTAKVTQQLLSKLGACPRFSTPDHPQSNGLVERWNGTFKSMLFHIVREHGREWDKFVPFLLWAYREVPNVTTGKLPFELMYGRVLVGPLSILQKTWSGDWAFPDTLGVSAEEYLSRLRERLIEANARAEDSTTVEQCRYASRYNLRVTDKQFREGQQVLWLEREGEGKLVAKWKGPAKVVRKLRPHSYLIETEDGTSRSVHANKLRAYHARVGAVGLIFEGDSDFGDIQTFPPQGERNHRIPLAALSPLKPSQCAEVVALVTRHGQVFRDRPGRCTVGMHKIKIKEGAARQPVHPYKVPMSFRKEVKRQVHELLAWDLIYPVESPHAYPIVCVSKKDGGLRLCCDYRKLNSITEPDAFPMSLPSELLLQVAKAKYITLIDMLRGYWQIPLDEQAQALTAFVTPVGQYAWRVMPFGLKNASATFQRIINGMLAAHREYACAYIDDLAVFSKTWEEHLQHLEKVLTAVAASAFRVNAAKCRFAKPEVEFLGHVVGSGKLNVDPAKVKAIEEIPAPQTKRELRSFLGLASSPHSAKLTRWALALQRFNLTIEHKRGVENANADALSRLVGANEETQ
ncbi:uncharacterized protein LOC121835094 [Ixodes scapularis]|uniref:uncharacterized protein LOC121835094 n=1 Tax=Ixodes scapularis TaxID=6945 RepID=UPI001A9D342D|nr:uncharacterized protein LOC121835094 [Ixodes scapularis]